QGPIFPRFRRFRHSRGSANQLRKHVAPRSRLGDRRHLWLLPRTGGDVAAGWRRQSPGRGGICARRRPLDVPRQLQQRQPCPELYSQGNVDNGFAFTGMYMNDAFHATNQIPQRAVSGGLLCLYCPLDPTDGGSSERYSFSTRYAVTTDTGQLKDNAYLIGYQLQLFNNFDGFVTFPPPIGDQFVQQDRRKIYGGNVSYMMPGNIF